MAPKPVFTDYVVGVDIGQVNDYTAISVVQRYVTQEFILPARAGVLQSVPVKSTLTYRVGRLERLELGMPYPDQVQHIKTLYGSVKKKGSARLIVDATGVGRPIVDLLRKERLAPIGVVITGADSETRGDGMYRVPKRNLASLGQVAFQSGRLQVPQSLRLADVLLKELKAFKVEIKRNGHDTYGNDWREAEHDDLVLALLLAVWWGEKHAPMTPELRQRLNALYR